MRTLDVNLGARSYPIHIGQNLLSRAELIAPRIAGKRCFVVSNETVAPLYMGKLVTTLKTCGLEVSEVILPDGEIFKTAETLGQIYDAMLTKRADRTTTVIALGGGVVGDMAGYAAATYQRGVPFIQIPTTLLSQVDSSVGGKTGINHPLGKNMIGAFWQPRLVLADTAVLKTLPPRELSAGLAEVIKYGLIGDAGFIDWLEAHMDRLIAADPEALGYAIEFSCAMKAAIVAGDELETAKEGGRALLNLGHTFGHAIETGMGYGNWLHGEAVATGMLMAAVLSCRLGWLTPTDVERIRELLKRANLPVTGPNLGTDRYLELMAHDKKVIDGQLRLVLLQGLGTGITWSKASSDDIASAIESCCHE